MDTELDEEAEDADDEEMGDMDVDELNCRQRQRSGKDSPTPDRESLHIDDMEPVRQNGMSTSKWQVYSTVLSHHKKFCKMLTIIGTP